MIEERVYTIEIDGQTFNLQITRPKTKRKFRGTITDSSKMDLGSGRWDTEELADAALREIAARAAARVSATKPAPQSKRAPARNA